MSGHRVAVRALLGAAALLALVPAAAAAHGLIQRARLPIPEWLFGWAAALVLIVSFITLTLRWPRPILEGSDRWRPLPGGRVLGGRAVQIACGAIGVALWALTIVAGFAGDQEPLDNLAPTFVFITFWVGLAIASPLFGDVYRALNPLRALGRLARLRGRHPYPERLGRWPAVAGLLAFTWLELCSGELREDPRAIAAFVLGYSVLTLGAMARYGVETWLERGETFAVYFNLLSRLSIFETRDGVVGRRRALVGLTRLETLPGTVAFVCAMIGTVTFDGLSQGKVWTSLGLPDTAGFVLAVVLVAAFYALGIRGTRQVGEERSEQDLRRAFVHSLVPIALVYVLAHYLSLFVFEGQGIIGLASDPLGQGWDLLGTADTPVDYGIISQNQTWYAQVAFVLAGHVAALVLAHERALVLFGHAQRAARSQYAMLAVMVGFTALALWLLAQAGSAVTETAPPAKTERSSRLVDFSKKPPYVNALDIDPATGDFLLTTNRGFWRVSRTGGEVTPIRGTITARGKRDTVGTFLLFKAVGGQRLIGSGHPDHQNTLPQFLGYLESDDLGRTWRVVSRYGGADLHKIVLAHDRLYAFDAVLSAIVVSTDEGRTFSEHFTPRGLILDFVVDPEDPDHLLADNDDELFESTDGGDRWRPLERGRRMRLAWPAADRLYRADQGGTIYTSADGGDTFERAGDVPGEPYRFLETKDPEHLYLALSDGTILETTDGARSFAAVFRP